MSGAHPIRWSAAWALVALVGCGVPDLDASGAIRCGTGNLCPDGYQCRVGRCCPAGSPTSACPRIPTGTAGATCAGATCSITRGVTSPIQGACLATASGYCVAACSATSPACGDFAACVPNGDASLCVRRCFYQPGTFAPCRNGPGEGDDASAGVYVCLKDPYDRDPNAGLCIPDCTRTPSICRAPEACDAVERRCVPSSCASSPSSCLARGQVCDASTGRCVACTANPTACLAAGYVCDLASGRCSRCSAGLACPRGQCNVVTGRCPGS